MRDTTDDYNNYRFHSISQRIFNFINNELSPIYMDIAKDRLYSDAKDSAERRSAQTALCNCLEVMVRILSPILSFTCEEVWENYKCKSSDSVQLAGWPELSDFVPKVDEAMLNVALDEYGKLLEIRDVYTRALEEKKVSGEYSKSQETGAKISLPDDYKPLVEKFGQRTIEELFICSDSEIEFGSDEIKVEIVKAKGEKCPRCWNYRELNAEGVCQRCSKVLSDLDFKFE